LPSKKIHPVLALAPPSVHNGQRMEMSRQVQHSDACLNFTVDLEALHASNQQKQRRRMMLALGLLLAALMIVIAKSRDVWFQAFSKSASQELQNMPVKIAKPQEGNNLSFHRVRKPKLLEATPPLSASPVEMKYEIQERVALPYAEVISSLGQSQMIYRRNSSIRLPLRHGSKLTNEMQRATTSSENIDVVAQPLQLERPLLAKPMNVQGSVALLARIDSAGNIERIQVLNGPEILARAAQDVLKQWRFRPYYKAGNAVETDTHITINFAIVTK